MEGKVVYLNVMFKSHRYPGFFSGLLDVQVQVHTAAVELIEESSILKLQYTDKGPWVVMSI